MRKKHLQLAIFISLLFLLSGCATPKNSALSTKEKWSNTPHSESKYYYFTAAQFQKQNDNIDNAIFYLKMAIKQDPESALLKKELVFLHLQQNSYEEALLFIEKLLEKDPDDVEALILEGNIRMYLKQTEKAKSLYEKVILLDPKKKNVYLFLGSIYLDEEDNQKALKVYKKMVNHFPNSYTGYFFLGRTQARLKNYTEAEKEFKKALDIEPMLLEPRYELLKIYKQENIKPKGQPSIYSNKEKITRLYKEILELYPDDARANMELAVFYHKTGLKKKAETIFNKLADKSLTDRDIAGKIIFLFIDQKKYDDAIIILKGILKRKPDNSDMNHLAGAAYDGVKNFEMALIHFKKVKEDSKFFENATIYISYIYKNQDEPRKALKHLENAILKVPDNGEFYFYLGYFHEDLQEYESAEEVLMNGLKIIPENPKLHFRLGVVYDKWGKKDKSIAEMKKVIGINPEDAHALNYLGYTYLDLNKNLGEAEILIRKAMEIEPKDGYITDSLGWLFFKKGLFQEALTTLEKAISLVPDDPIILEHIGDVHIKINNRQKALEFYKRALIKKDKDTDDLKEKIKELSYGNE